MVRVLVLAGIQDTLYTPFELPDHPGSISGSFASKDILWDLLTQIVTTRLSPRSAEIKEK